MTEARLDKWLFCARLYRTRLLAQQATSAGKVRLNGSRVDKPGRAIKAGDVLTLGRGTEILAVKVLGLAERRGFANEARHLYEILE
jgi:ribosome-associated heat shock protein Hsp15